MHADLAGFVLGWICYGKLRGYCQGMICAWLSVMSAELT